MNSSDEKLRTPGLSQATCNHSSAKHSEQHPPKQEFTASNWQCWNTLLSWTLCLLFSHPQRRKQEAKLSPQSKHVKCLPETQTFSTRSSWELIETMPTCRRVPV